MWSLVPIVWPRVKSTNDAGVIHASRAACDPTSCVFAVRNLQRVDPVTHLIPALCVM